MQIILEDPDILTDMRKLVGISDKRLYLDLTYLVHFYSVNNIRFVPEARKELRKHSTKYFVRLLRRSEFKQSLARQISAYFISHGLIETLDTFSSLSKEQIIPIFQNLIAPREIQQMQAKYRGHGAEQAFAQILTACGLEIFPKNKDKDPMASHDPNVNLSTMAIVQRTADNDDCHSFDLIIKDSDSKIRILIQSLIHSSDPGQYGVNKSNETIDIKKRLKLYNNKINPNEKVYLLGCVDGVGFCENPNGTIIKMLEAFDDFFQMHTLFKVPVFLQKIGIIDNIKGICFDKQFFETDAIQHFETTYLHPAGVANMTGKEISNLRILNAGKATIIFK